MSRGQVECCVCLERVRRDHALWSCGTCYAIVHLNCAKRWARRTDETSGTALGFACPSCRTVVKGKGSPQHFWCYCGRQKNPALEAGIVPGSCGEICGKPKGATKSQCPHTCSELLCHPGPCPPCNRPGEPTICHCGKEQIPRKCGAPKPDDGVSCLRVCGKQLPCGHECIGVCHRPGNCDECMVACTIKCHCGAASTELPCSLSVDGHSCGGVCGKLKSCRNHYCSETCHSGDCPSCARDPAVVYDCACGKRRLTEAERAARGSCADPIPSCGAPCGLSLGCLADHKCEAVCGHDGDCGPCEKTVSALCRCGASAVSVACGEDPDRLQEALVCKTICNDKLTCKKHRCERQCCKFRKRKALTQAGVVDTVGFFGGGNIRGERDLLIWRRDGHKCEELCERVLSCGLHMCDARCGHTDSCPPCGHLIREGISCECGAERLPGPVRCGTERPPCMRRCPKPRTLCSHPCPDRCHSGPCPPCVELVRKECVGRHGEARFVLCHIGGPEGIRCHRACGRALKCGMHACRSECHGNFPAECEPSETSGCGQICGLPRECGHGCTSQCHPDALTCPETPCMANVNIRCSCGRRTDTAPCLRGGPRGLVPIGSDGLIRLQCDEKCEEQRRLTAFASAIGTTPTTLTAMRKVGRTSGGYVGEDGVTVFSPFLLDFASRESAALAYFERELGNIVSGRVRKVDFGTLPQLYRAVLHGLAELYLLDSESTGKGAARRVVVNHRGAGTKPVSPIPLLSEAHARDRAKERLRNAPEARSLVVYVPRGPRNSEAADNGARVERELSSHLGNYKIVGRQDMVGTGGEPGTVVEFSTVSRMELARSVLSSRPGIVVSVPSMTLVRAPNPKLSKQGGSGNHPAGRASAPVQSGWGPEDAQNQVPSSRACSSSSRDPPPASNFNVLPPVPADSSVVDNAPDSWEDS